MNRGPWVSFIDVLALMLIVLFLLPMKPDVSAADDSRAGMVVMEAHWADRSRADVDLWVLVPEDDPVGYSRLRGRSASLFRDDLGNDAAAKWRYEIAATRSIPDGEYIVNLHLFADAKNEAPISVNVTCWFRGESGYKVPIWSGDVVLGGRGMEITAVRWRMASGRVLPGSLHHSPAKIRSGGRAP